MNFLILFVIVKSLGWIIKDLSKPEDSDVDQIINELTEKKPIKYIYKTIMNINNLNKVITIYFFPKTF
jgi:hypothetical protein